MAIVASYAAGTPAWVDLTTTDPDGAKRFYEALFGWEYQVGGAEEGFYTMCRVRGHDAAGIGGTASTEVPPAWTTYLATDDVTAAAERITGAGGTLLFEPMQVAQYGHMLIGADPTGAVFGLWQPLEHIGSSLVNEPGGIVWSELATRDSDRAHQFYTDVMGWSWQDVDTGGGPRYQTFAVEGRDVGGCLQMDASWPEAIPSHWMPYFAVADTDASILTAEAAGGVVSVPATDSPHGRFAVLLDPQGAVFTVVSAPQES